MKNNDQVIHLKAAEKVTIYKRRFSSIPLVYQFYADSPNELSGWIEINTKQTVIKKPKKRIKLQKNNEIKLGMWDTFVDIDVIADGDVIISIPTKKIASTRTMISLILIIVIIGMLAFLPGFMVN